MAIFSIEGHPKRRLPFLHFATLTLESMAAWHGFCDSPLQFSFHDENHLVTRLGTMESGVSDLEDHSAKGAAAKVPSLLTFPTEVPSPNQMPPSGSETWPVLGNRFRVGYRLGNGSSAEVRGPVHASIVRSNRPFYPSLVQCSLDSMPMPSCD